MRFKVLLVVLSIVLWSCGSSKTKATPQQIEKLQQRVDSRNLEIISDRAYPQNTSSMNMLQNSGLLQPGSNANMINLIGNVNYLKIKGDSIFAELPYFGERRMNAAYNGTDSSIVIENVLQDYTMTSNENDGSISISFNAKSQTELLRFNITLYPNYTSSMFLNGPTRTLIQYTGRLSN